MPPVPRRRRRQEESAAHRAADPALDELPRRSESQVLALIAECKPRSTPLSLAENAARERGLRSAVDDRGLRFYPAMSLAGLGWE